eukprot:scaffold7791_cov457-Prasinococcus_capsulatus_cf.AAC.5
MQIVQINSELAPLDAYWVPTDSSGQLITAFGMGGHGHSPVHVVCRSGPSLCRPHANTSTTRRLS